MYYQMVGILVKNLLLACLHSVSFKECSGHDKRHLYKVMADIHLRKILFFFFSVPRLDMAKKKFRKRFMNYDSVTCCLLDLKRVVKASTMILIICELLF